MGQSENSKGLPLVHIRIGGGGSSVAATPRAGRVLPRGLAGGTGERVAREPLTGRVAGGLMEPQWSGPVGERATPTRYAVRGPCPWDRTRQPQSAICPVRPA